MSRLFNISCLLATLIVLGCQKDSCSSTECNASDNDTRCSLVPEIGPCNAAFPKYYFDPVEKKCKSFTWGGCAGVVPFDTLEDCNQKCPCQNN